MTFLSRRLVLGLPALASASARAAEPTYPSQPIRLIVPFVAGGNTDIVARLMADRLRSLFPQPVVIENRAGASGAIGSELVARSPADGHVLLVNAAPPLTTLRALRPGASFNPLAELAPVASVAVSRYILAVHPSFPARTLAELVALAKERPGTLSYASNGQGTMSHLLGTLFARTAGIDLIHVPYQGSGQVRADLLTGRVSMMFENTAMLVDPIDRGELRGLAATVPERLPWAPSIPTVREAGSPALEVGTWTGLFAPAGTPEPVLTLLHEAVGKLLADDDFDAALRRTGGSPAANSREEFARLLRESEAQWTEVITGSRLDNS